MPNPQQTRSDTLLMAPHQWQMSLEAYAAKTPKSARVGIAINDPFVATIQIHGLLMPSVPQELTDWGFDATGYDAIAQAVTEAANNDTVKQILLHVDSGGGMVAGVNLAADAIFEASQKKPVIAYVSGMAASAAYWLASQASEIQANPLAEIGGIGVYTVIYDSSAILPSHGVAVHVLRSGPLKGTGAGDKITTEQLQAQQDIVDGMARQFIEAVARGRKSTYTQIDAYASGRTWLADAAKEIGLIDRLGGVDLSTNGGFSTMANPDINPVAAVVEPVVPVAAETAEETEMPVAEPSESIDKTPEPDAVQIERERASALTALFADDAAFLKAAIDGGMSVAEAKVAKYDALIAAGTVLPAPLAAQPVAFGGEPQDAPTSWNAAVKQVAEDQGVSLSKAASIADKLYPGLRAATFGRA